MTVTNNLEIAKKIIKENFEEHDCGIFNTRNIVGDFMETIYNKDELQIDVCDGYAYFEVFGLSEKEFGELEKYYHDLKER